MPKHKLCRAKKVETPQYQEQPQKVGVLEGALQTYFHHQKNKPKNLGNPIVDTLNAANNIVNTVDTITDKVIQVKQKGQKIASKFSDLPPDFAENLTAANDLDQLGQATNTFKLKGDIGEFLGDLERFELAILLKGDPGAGKSRLSYRFANAFADIGYKVAYNTYEMGKNSNLIIKMREDYIDKQNQQSILFNDKMNDLEDIKVLAKHFDVVIIDSWGKLKNAKIEDFDKLRKQFPETIFVVIFQSTVTGGARGGAAPGFDAGSVIHVVSTPNFKTNYAYHNKSRYTPHSYKFNVFANKIISDESGKWLPEYEQYYEQ